MNTKKITAVSLNLFIVLAEFFTLIYIVTEPDTGALVYYTEESNILAMLGAFTAFTAELIALLKKTTVPKWVTFFKYMTTCLTTVTMIVVLTVLGPMQGSIKGYFYLLTDGRMLWHHTICPLLMVISFVLFEREQSLIKRAPLYALIPTLIYGIILVILNLKFIVVGPYPFLMVYQQSVFMSVVWSVVIVGGAYLIARLIKKLHG